MTTQESYIRSVYKVIFYIEQNYHENLTLEELSRVAGFSKYHFHRIFKAVAGENLADYLRRARLQSAVLKLKTTKNVTQIALESGYETNASFSKAFKKQFCITPKECAKEMKMKRGTKMLKPTIVEIEPIEVLFVRKTGNYMSSADAAWKTMVEFVTEHDLFEKAVARYGIAHDNPRVIEEQNLRYDACLELSQSGVQEQGEVTKKVITSGKYALFVHEGAYEFLGETFKNIGDWIVENGIALRDEPQFQKYLDLDPTGVKEKDLRTEIYVPIK